jgi:GDPmannose 4,6-dehydratase
MKTALITGITGQDGAYLAELLLKKRYRVVGARRHTSSVDFSRLRRLGIQDDVETVSCDLLEESSVRSAVERVLPDEIYNLAAQSSIAYGLECPMYTANADALGVLRLLEAIRTVDPGIKFFQASSSELFGTVNTHRQTEETSFHPRSPYGVAKLFGHWSVRNYREVHGIHASSGILYNHTSPLQSTSFVARKIVVELLAIRRRQASVLMLGNLDARRDWGFSGDYVDAMWRMLQLPCGGDYVIATGVTTTVRSFTTLIAAELGVTLQWSGSGIDEIGTSEETGDVVVRIDPKLYRPVEVGTLCGDSTKALSELGWKASVNIAALAEMLVEAEV